jgi:hypothetical protein
MCVPLNKSGTIHSMGGLRHVGGQLNNERSTMAKAATWRGVGVHTVRELQRRHRRLDRWVNSANFIISCMRAGATLHLTYRRNGPVRSLSDGRRVSDEIAQMVIVDRRVAAVGDSLFRGMTSQTYRYTEL